MPNTNPTIVSASLSDKELQDSINKMVANFDKGLQTMLEHSNEYVGKIQESLQKIGNTNFGAKGSNDGAVVKQTKAQHDFTEAVKKSTDEIKRQGKETAMSFDQIAAAKQKAVQSQSMSRNSIENLNNLRSQLQFIESEKAKAAKNFGSLFTMPYDQQADAIRAKIREITQGVSVVNSEQKQVTTSVQQTTQAAQRYTEEIRKQAQAIRESQQWKEKGFVTVDGSVLSNQENVAKKKRISLEEQILNLQQQGIYLSQDQTTKEWQLVDANGRRVAFIQQENENLAKQRERVAEIANDVRRLFADGSFGKISFTPSPLSGVRYIYQENDERSKGLTIEQQIEKILKEQSAEYERQASTKKASNNGSQRTLNDLQSQARAIEELLEKGKRVKALGGFEFIPADMSGQTVMQQIISYQEQRKAGLLAENQALNLQLELSNAIAQAQGRIAQEQEKRKKYVSPTINDDAYQITRNAIARKLGIDTSKVINADAQYDSIKRVGDALKQLQDAYTRMTNEERKSPIGKQMIRQMQELQRQSQQLRAQMSRPISLKDALSGSEKTIDDITYKIQQLQSYKRGLNLTDPKQVSEIKQVDAEINRLQKDLNKYMGTTKQATEINNALGRSWNYMKNRLAFYVTVGAGTSFIKQLIDIRSQYEMNEKALGILLDSASRGTRIFNELSQMALVSPYTLIELSNAAKQLTAYDIAAKDVVDTTRRLADMASAVGVPVERLTYALGQIKAYGYLNSRDARMFANAGIPLVKQLADRYSELEGKMVSTADVYDRMKKKAIDYNDVMAVINKMTDEGGKFFDFQAKMAETLKVRLANLTLAWNNMLNDMGKDNQGWFSSGLKGLTTVFKHWRELYRIISTVIVAIGAYKTASMVAGIAASRAVSSTIPAWFRLASIIRTTQGNIALLGLAMRSIPFTAWVTAIATLASYFILFNNSSDDVKQKLEDIKSAFDGVRKEVETLFADAIKTDNIGTQLTKLRDMLELAETELGVTIPINLEDVNESNIKQKLKEAKQFVDEYTNFSQTFSEAAAGTKFNELMNDFGSKARSTYTNVTESINSVVVALQELSDKGQASKRDIEILNELASGQKEDESRIEYLQRLISLYEELGLIGQEKVEPMIEHNFFKSFFSSTWDNMEELEQNQEENLDRLGIKNNTVFENMLKDVQEYYSSSITAAYQFEQQVMRVAEKIDINNIPVEQRTMKLTAAINEEASQNNWNQFEKEFARQIANEKFGTTIEISDESKKATEEDLQDWQRNIQNWAKNNGITFDVRFQTNDTEASYAKRMLQEAKDAKELWETLGRKEKQGTGSKDATTKAYNDYIERRKLASAAGADLSSLDAKSRKAASKAEAELAKALKDELSTIDKVRSIYKDLTKEGMSHANAVERATKDWNETVNAINRVLQKNGLQKLDLSKFAGIENPRELVNILQSQLNTLLKRGAKPAEIKELQTKVNTLEVDADKYDLTKITKGLNNELGKLKDEYELAVELDANPELGDMFADMFGINTSTLPKTFGDALDRAQIIINRKLAEMNITTPFDLMEGNIYSFAKSTGLDKDGAVIKELVSAQNAYRNMFKKNITETEKMLDDYIKKYGDYSDKIAEIEAGRLEKLKKLNEAYYTEEMRKRPEYTAKLNAIEQGASKEKQQVDFDDFKNSRYYTMMFENLDYISTKTIRDMRDRVRELIDTMNNLTPEQLKTLMSQYEKLEQKLVKRSPFKTLTKDLKEYFATSKERNAANQEFKNAQKEYDAQKKNVAALKEKYEQAKANSNTSKSYLDFLQIEIDGENDILKILKEQLDAAQKKADKYNLTAKLAKSEALQVAQVVGQNLQSLGELRDFLQQDLGVELSDELNGLVDGLSKVGQGINKITSSATSGDVVGVITGVGQTIYGLYDGIASIFGGGSAADKKITKQIQDSERAVKRLELAYIDLQKAVDRAYGTSVIGAKTAAAAAKKLELQEIERQLRLEKSRDSKHKDESRIVELQKQIKELRYEIQDTYTEIVNDLMGTDVGSFAENLVSAMIDAFKQGEDAMKVFNDKFDELIDNMIMKSLTSRIVSSYIDKLWEDQETKIKARSKKESDDLAKAQAEYDKVKNMSEGEWLMYHYGTSKFSTVVAKAAEESGLKGEDLAYYLKNLYDKRMEALEASVGEANKALSDATAWTSQDINDVMSKINSMKGGLYDDLMEGISQWYTFGEDSDKNLSALQQGLQSMSEDTGSALESYMNGVSQQVYAQTEYLRQIAEVITRDDNPNDDVKVASLSQILLQLQQSYTVQQSIQSILEGWNNPSGQAVRVELVS